MFDVFEDFWWFVKWHPLFCVAVLVIVLAIVFCLYLLIQRERFKKLQIAYNFLPNDVSSVDLIGFLGAPNSQYAGNGIITWHYHFRLGFSSGVYMFSLDSHTGLLVNREQKMF